jgi:NAD(P)H-dependent FMN reductase
VVEKLAQQRDDAEFELVDLLDYNLPHLDEHLPPSLGQYANEYNHSTSGALKNAIDFLYAEWNNKAAGFVSYGAQGGARAAEHLRLVMGELQVADVRAQVTLYLHSDFENYTAFKPYPQHEGVLTTMLDQLVSWSTALRSTRSA